MKPNTIRCHICGEKYLEHALKKHHSQMAGKEAQYLMADLFYQDTKKFINIPKEDIMELCPHWKWILANPIVNKLPVSKKLI